MFLGIVIFRLLGWGGADVGFFLGREMRGLGREFLFYLYFVYYICVVRMLSEYLFILRSLGFGLEVISTFYVLW